MLLPRQDSKPGSRGRPLTVNSTDFRYRAIFSVVCEWRVAEKGRRRGRTLAQTGVGCNEQNTVARVLRLRSGKVQPRPTKTIAFPSRGCIRARLRCRTGHSVLCPYDGRNNNEANALGPPPSTMLPSYVRASGTHSLRTVRANSGGRSNGSAKAANCDKSDALLRGGHGAGEEYG